MFRRIIHSLGSDNRIFGIPNNNIIINNAKQLFLITLLSVFLISSYISINMNFANAQLNFDDFMKQTQKSIQSTIENSNNNDNNDNNDCNNNISIQSQTNDNGETTSTTRSTCDDKTTTSTTTNNGQSNALNKDLNGTISSSEINPVNGTVINSLYGNWSLYARDNGSKDFNASFIKQSNHPIDTTATNVTNTITPSNTPQNNETSGLTSTNTTSYSLSNFLANSVQQQNSDVTYSGKIDVIKETRSINATVSNETNNFKGVGVSISIADNRILIVNFDSASPLYKEFENIPVIGLVK